MKQFLVPAALLAFVGATAVLAAGSVANSVHGCPPSPACPYSDARCSTFQAGAAGAAEEQSACQSHEADVDDCSRCEEHPDAACCQKKVGCPGCKGKPEKSPESRDKP